MSQLEILFFLGRLFKFMRCRSGGIGRHTVLRGQGPKGRAGSSPAFGTWTLLTNEFNLLARGEFRGSPEEDYLQTSNIFSRFRL